MFTLYSSLLVHIFLCLTINFVRAGPSIEGARGTIYYDLEYQCTGPGADAGGASGLNGALTACGYSAAGLGTSRFVAIDGSIFSKSMCGQEVKITQNGVPFTFSEGPLFVGDLCGGCNGGTVLDVSGKIAVEMMGGCKNPPLLSYQITENIVGATLEGSLPPNNGAPPVGSSAVPPPQPSVSSPYVPTANSPAPTTSAVVPPPANTVVPPPANTAVPPANTVVPPVNPATSPVVPPTQPANPPTQPAIPPTQAAPPPTQPSNPAIPSHPQYTQSARPVAPASAAPSKFHGGGGWGGWHRPTPEALFAENETATNGTSCKRRKRRRFSRAH